MVALERDTSRGIVPTAKGIPITILGDISQAEMIDITLSKPQAVQYQRQMTQGDGRKWSSWNKAEHFLAYISNVINVLDRKNMKGNYLVMDNAPIRTTFKVR
jgi:hypothetical protein